MEQMIIINTYGKHGDDWGCAQVEVIADVIDNFAVHKAIEGDVYRVTHVPTSIGMGSSPDLGKVLARREYLRNAKVGGVPVSQLPACEIVASALLIAQQIGCKTEQDKILHTASTVAEVLCKS